LSSSEANLLPSAIIVYLRKTDGELYAPKSLMTIRFGLQKHFIQKRNDDIINNVGYAEANTMFKAMLVHIKKEGNAGVNHKEPILCILF
jgi:hypothetical protein